MAAALTSDELILVGVWVAMSLLVTGIAWATNSLDEGDGYCLLLVVAVGLVVA